NISLKSRSGRWLRGLSRTLARLWDEGKVTVGRICQLSLVTGHGSLVMGHLSAVVIGDWCVTNARFGCRAQECAARELWRFFPALAAVFRGRSTAPARWGQTMARLGRSIF